MKVANDARNKGLEVLLVSYDLQLPDAEPVAVQSRVERFVTRMKWGLPVVVFDSTGLEEINSRYRLPGPIPVTLAFDANGVEVDREEGEAGVERFQSLANRAFGR